MGKVNEYDLPGGIPHTFALSGLTYTAHSWHLWIQLRQLRHRVSGNKPINGWREGFYQKQKKPRVSARKGFTWKRSESLQSASTKP